MVCVEKKQDIYDKDEATRRRPAPPQQAERLYSAGSYPIRIPDPAIPATMMNRTYSTLFFLLAAGILLTPVSYTHLDVYKRQHQRR